jgi:putative ABC transport system permease protein
MGVFMLAIAQLRAKPFNSILSIIMFAIGMGIISILLQLEKHSQQHIRQNIARIDMVVGAKGSPLQLILSSVLHADNPTGNIPLSEAAKISDNPMVDKTIPLALGDNYLGFRIVGTSRDYAMLYQTEIEKGYWNESRMEVVIGATAAKRTGLRPGDYFTGVHGFMEEGHSHDEHPYLVTGILKRSGTVIDNLILTNVESVWHVHDTTDGHDEECCNHHHENPLTEEQDFGHTHHHENENDKIDAILHKVAHQEDLTVQELNLYNRHLGNLFEKEKSPEGEITALLVFYRSPAAVTMLPRMVNESTNLQAASPAIELNRLMSLLGIGFDILRIVAWIIILFSAINIMIHLLNNLNNEIYEIALMRTLGVRQSRIMLLLLSEGTILAMCGWLAGMLLSRITILFVPGIAESYSISFMPSLLMAEVLMLVYALAIGFVAAIIPASKAYNTDIHFLLNKL